MVMAPCGARTASRFVSLAFRHRTSRARHRVDPPTRGGRTIAATMPLPSEASRSSSAWCCARRCDVRQPVRATAGLWPDARCRTVGHCPVRRLRQARRSDGIGTGGSIAWGSADSGCRLEPRTRRFLRRGASPERDSDPLRMRGSRQRLNRHASLPPGIRQGHDGSRTSQRSRDRPSWMPHAERTSQHPQQGGAKSLYLLRRRRLVRQTTVLTAVLCIAATCEKLTTRERSRSYNATPHDPS